MSDLSSLRRRYALETLSAAGVVSPRLQAAFAAVPREDYLGPGPWRLFGGRDYEQTIDDDPAHLYQNVLVALLPEKRINNGQPSGHAAWLAAADPQPGEHAVHIGAGTGYYSAILAELVGPEGRVTAIEHDGGLAARARQNLARYPNVVVVHADGVVHAFDPADVIYVNAGVARPADNWLDRLRSGGRLVLPLTALDAGGGALAGAMFCIRRDGDTFAVKLVTAAAFVSCEGLHDPDSDAALANAFRRGGVRNVTRLVRAQLPPGPDVWLSAPGWSLLTRPSDKIGPPEQSGGA